MTGTIKRMPQRTCIACHRIKSKRELVRIVKVGDEGIIVDDVGKKPGRGAYLCKTKECWENGLAGNRLEYVLHATISQQDRKRLEEYAERVQLE
jgi:hypothetical protein